MRFETLQKDMITAMKERNKARKEAISSLISDVKKAAIDAGCRDDISEALTDQVISKSLKTAKEQLDTCPKERTDLLEQYQYRYDVIKEYAPTLMSREEIEAFVKEGFADLLAEGKKGPLMKLVMGQLKGKADGKEVSAVVSSLCEK